MMTTEEIERFFSSIALVERPLPKFKTIVTASAEVRKTWDRGFLPHDMVVRLWKKLDARGSEAVVTELEYPLLARVLFVPSGEDLPPLMYRSDVLAYASNIVTSTNDPTLSHDFAKTYLRLHEPVPELDDITRTVAEVALRDKPGATFVRRGFFETEGPARFAAQLSPTELINSALVRIGAELLEPRSAYVTAVWRQSFARYAAMVEAARSDSIRLAATLDFIRHDSQTPEGHLRSPADATRFACAVAAPFLKNPRDLPSREVREELFNFFVYFFGDPRDSINTVRWEPIRTTVGKLFEIWETGKELENLFLFMGEALSLPPRHWEDRRPFWFRYWRAGRIRDWRLYTLKGKRQRCLFDENLRNRYPNILSKLGILNGRSGTNFMMLFELDDNILVSEFSDSGKIRIGHPTEYLNPRRSVVDWVDVRDLDYWGIPHSPNGGWKYQTDRRIAELSGLRPPR